MVGRSRSDSGEILEKISPQRHGDTEGKYNGYLIQIFVIKIIVQNLKRNFKKLCVSVSLW